MSRGKSNSHAHPADKLTAAGAGEVLELLLVVAVPRQVVDKEQRVCKVADDAGEFVRRAPRWYTC